MKQVLCKHNQTGYCKFGHQFQKQHDNEICKSQSCSLKKCRKRHPAMCKYLNENGCCKFGEGCAYMRYIKWWIANGWVLPNGVVPSGRVGLVSSKVRRKSNSSRTVLSLLLDLLNSNLTHMDCYKFDWTLMFCYASDTDIHGLTRISEFNRVWNTRSWFIVVQYILKYQHKFIQFNFNL